MAFKENLKEAFKLACGMTAAMGCGGVALVGGATIATAPIALPIAIGGAAVAVVGGLTGMALSTKYMMGG
jgi:hypothetical protein